MTVNNSHLKSYSVAQELVKNSRWPKLFSSSVFCNLIIHKVQTMNNERWARRGQKQLSMCLTLANESMTIDYTFYKLTSVSHQVSGSVSSSLTHARPVMIHGDSLLVVFKVRHPDILDFVVLVCWSSLSTQSHRFKNVSKSFVCCITYFVCFLSGIVYPHESPPGCHR